MAEFEEAISEVSAVLRDLRALAVRGDEGTDDLVRMRARLANAILALNKQVAIEPRLQGDPALHAEFQERWAAVRHKWTEHQLKWKMVDVENDTPGHRSSGKVATAAFNEFFDWSRRQLDNC